eukprot:1553891-Amphidinium_carterae.1
MADSCNFAMVVTVADAVQGEACEGCTLPAASQIVAHLSSHTEVCHCELGFVCVSVRFQSAFAQAYSAEGILVLHEP